VRSVGDDRIRRETLRDAECFVDTAPGPGYGTNVSRIVGTAALVGMLAWRAPAPPGPAEAFAVNGTCTCATVKVIRSPKRAPASLAE
jgi:hypothetical protein